MVSLRAARHEDAPALAALSIEVWLHTYIRRGITVEFATYALDHFTVARFASVLSDPGERVFVSENLEGIDGYVRIAAGRPSPVAGCSDAEIVTLYVQSRHQGRGIGQALLAQVLAEGAAFRAERPWLAVNSENTDAIAFYRRQGFSIVGQTRFHIGSASYANEVMAPGAAAG